LTAEDFEKFALSLFANADNDQGYVEYMISVKDMFQGLADGRFSVHKQQFPEVFLQVCGHSPMSFEQWLLQSSHRKKLNLTP
jgi:hypothetical protein